MLKLDKYYDDLPWLRDLRAQLTGLVADGRCPHALLIQGRQGSGRRQLALWLAEAILGANPARSVNDQDGGHPDFRAVERLINPDTKKLRRDISIDQIRELTEFLTLTSHGGRGRVAVVYPTESLNWNAANSMLKTLEEPPSGAVILLICESPARLPATILSRCQRVKVPPSSDSGVLEWLAAESGGADLARLLDFAGGAPLAALELHESGFPELANGFASDLAGLEQRRISPTAVAAKWVKTPEMALEWLYWHLARRVRAGLETEEGVPAARLAPCFGQMSQIRELRRLINGGINAELSFAELLMGWYGGLENRT